MDIFIAVISKRYMAHTGTKILCSNDQTEKVNGTVFKLIFWFLNYSPNFIMVPQKNLCQFGP